MTNPTRGDFLEEIYQITNDPACFDQDTGELNPGYIVKAIAIPREFVNIISDMAEQNPELLRVANNIVDTLWAEYDKSEVTTILALAGSISLPKEVLKESVSNATFLMIATSAVATFHLLAAEIIDETFVQPLVQIAFSEQD